jgi:DNA-binding NarL/FixJ family response regulator
VTPVLRSLTEQERKILLFIGEGLSNREIGDRMHIAEQTVKNHVSRLLAKLNVSNRTQAALMLMRSEDEPTERDPEPT